jgi:hypothetical protein
MACNFKGQGFIGLLIGLAQLRGPDAKLKLLPRVNAELRVLIERDAIIASGWYPLAWYSEVTKAIRDEYGDDIGLEIGRLGMRNDINSFIRFILALASPLMLLHLSSRVFRIYFQGASLETSQSGPQEGRLKMWGLEGSNASTWAAIGGAVAAFVELSGGKDVKVRVDKDGGDLPQCEFVVSWA